MKSDQTTSLMECPLPYTDYDIVTLGHGSGGSLTHELLDKMVFELFHNPALDTHHDGAIFAAHGNLAFSTDSYVVQPIFFPGGNIGDLAVNGTCNDLAMCGAIPKQMSLSLILEEGLPLIDLWNVLVSVRKATDRAHVQIVTGDTKVVERGKGDQLFINTTGIGMLHGKARLGLQHLCLGDGILCSGPLASHGIAIMAQRQELRFDVPVKSDTRSVAVDVELMLNCFGEDLHFFRDPTRGGAATVLNEMVMGTEFGIDLEETALPVLPEVAAACELLGLDPLFVANEGLFLVAVARSQVSECLAWMHSHGMTAACQIGQITDEHAGKVVARTGIGGRRVVTMLPGDQLPRIC